MEFEAITSLASLSQQIAPISTGQEPWQNNKQPDCFFWQPGGLREIRGFPSPPRDGFGLGKNL
jgi:hypothetical protein